MRKLHFISGIVFCSILLLTSCASTKKQLDISESEKEIFNKTEGDPVVIADEKTEYEITIIDPGFDFWLASHAKPYQFYSQSYLESKNIFYVAEWNSRVSQPFRHNTSLYEMQIDYAPGTDYGYEVNYKLYNYFIYFQRKYNQRLGHFVPRI
ncbi:DUF6146 family protein [Cellulophaga sp. F20128]|uniref:DUF6146 family protein n=1 Tax=Cellulophaga sp. F20128 TaxID=2926413 RepID=UPI001FF2CE4C|nr:DUF6146 family protein [Cellulophaga sp. F20128]MCK0157838.1 DUF6146 family protein [Cellulophaga sp. F20128]